MSISNIWPKTKQSTITKCFKFLKPVSCCSDIPFFDEENDCIVLNVMPCQDDASFALPEPFTLFSSIAPAVRKFYLIGHIGGDPKEV